MQTDDRSRVAPGNSGQTDVVRYESQTLAEYVALRSEIIHRMGMRHQIIAFSVGVLGAVLALKAPPSTVLAYPILGLFLALGWAHNDFRIGEIGEYVRTEIERRLPGLGWETHFFALRRAGGPLRFRLRATILSAGGIIAGTQVLALVVSLCQQAFSPATFCLVGVDVLVIGLTLAVLHWRQVLYWRTGSQTYETSGAVRPKE